MSDSINCRTMGLMIPLRVSSGSMIDKAQLKEEALGATRRTFRSVAPSGAVVEMVVDGAQGGRIASLVIDGLELLVTREEAPTAMRWGSFPMAPWAGRVRRGRFEFGGREHLLPIHPSGAPHALHGTVWQRPWRWVGDAEMEVDLGPDWPFPGRVVQRFELSPTALEVTLEVHADSQPFPTFFGWHPWWRRNLSRDGRPVGAPYRLDWRPGSMLLRDADGIPDGKVADPPPGPWDDCFFAVDGPVVLEWPGALRLQVSSSCAYWVVYDRPEHAICVEPQSGPPDGFSLGKIPGLPPTYRVAEPGRPVTESMRLEWQVP